MTAALRAGPVELSANGFAKNRWYGPRAQSREQGLLWLADKCRHQIMRGDCRRA